MMISDFTYQTYAYDERDLHLSPTDAAVGLIENIDIDAQIRAINHVFSIIDQGEKEFQNKIEESQKKIKKSKSRFAYKFLEDDLIDSYQHSVYFDAAKSLNTVSMLAPLLESVYIEIFQNIHLKFNQIIEPRFNGIRHNHKHKWNCKYSFENGTVKKGIAKGIIELSEITGLKKYVLGDLEIVLSIIFTYRNFILHNGIEWSESEKRKFQNKVEAQEWPNDWISFSTINKKPWIYYLTDKFREKALNCLECLEPGVGKLFLELSKQNYNM